MYVNVFPTWWQPCGSRITLHNKMHMYPSDRKKYEGQLINGVLALTRAFHVYKDNHTNLYFVSGVQ